MINKENGENQFINSELSSSLITSYNSDDRDDQLRVRERVKQVAKNQVAHVRAERDMLALSEDVNVATRAEIDRSGRRRQKF